MKAALSLFIFGLVAVSAIQVKNIKPYGKLYTVDPLGRPDYHSPIYPPPGTEFAPGKMYLYDYSAQLLTGIPKIADQFAGLKMKCQIVFQAKESSEQVAMKLTNVKISQSQDLKNVRDGLNVESQVSGEEEMAQKWIKEYIRQLAKPITFTHVNGQVVSFVADQSEPEWSLNIKKSILTLFHLNLQPKQVMRSEEGNHIAKPVSHEDLTYFGVFESGMTGVCESVYELAQIPNLHSAQSDRDAVLNVTKTKNYRNCLTRSTLALNDNMSARHSGRKSSSSFIQAVRGYYPVPSHYNPSFEMNSPIKQYTSTKYNISLVKDVAQIEQIRSEGKIIYSTFGDNIMAYTHQKVNLVKVSQASQSTLGSISNPQMHEELSYQFPKVDETYARIALDIPHMSLYSQEKHQELTANLPKLFESLARAVLDGEKANGGNNKDAMQKVVQIVNSLAALPRERIEEVYRSIAQAGLEKNAAPQHKLTRKMFLDALALTGSNEAAFFIAQMIANREVTGHEAREMLAALPRNMNFPTAKTLDSYLELLQSQRVTSDSLLHPAVAVAFGKMVNTAFIKNGRIQGAPANQEKTVRQEALADESVLEIAQNENKNNQWQNKLKEAAAKKEDLERYIVVVSRILESADSFSKKVAAIECLAHMGAKEVLATLEPYVTGSASVESLPGYEVEDKADLIKERNYLRTIAIYSLAHVSRKNPKQVLPLVLPVYRNSAEPHEMRLAAFTIAMLCRPEQHIIESIAADLYQESNKQVTHFVVSALNSIGNLTTPCQRSLAQAAAQAAESAPKEAQRSSKYSTYKSGDFYDQKRSFGMWYAAEWINSRMTPIPRAGYLAASQISSPFHDELLEIGFETKGLERIVKRIIGSNGLIAQLFESKNSARSAQEQQTRDGKLQESAKLNLFVKMFEQTSIYPLDENMINQYVEQVENWAREVIAQGFTGTFVKVLMPSTISKVSASEIGLPVVLAHKRPLIVSLKVNKFNADKQTHSNGAYKGYSLTADIEPRIMYSSYAFVYGIEPVSKTTIGTHVEKTYHAYLPLKATLTHQHENQQWSLVVKPKSGYEAVYHKSEALTFLSKAKIVFAPARDWLESARTIRSENASPAKFEKTLSHSKVPVAAQVTVETENQSELDQATIRKSIAKNGLLSALINIFRNSNLNTREVRVRVEDNAESQQQELRFNWNAKRIEREESEYQNEDRKSCPNGVTEEIVERITCAITGKQVEEVHQCEKKVARDAQKLYSAVRKNLKWIQEGDKEMTPEERDEQERERQYEARRQEQSQEFQGNNEQSIMRTQFIVRKNQVCFTTRPVMACANNAEAATTEQVTREFHCLPRSAPLTHQLMKDAETSVLKQLANKRVDFREELTVPQTCSA